MKKLGIIYREREVFFFFFLSMFFSVSRQGDVASALGPVSVQVLGPCHQQSEEALHL